MQEPQNESAFARKLASTRAEWARRLIDTTRRNPLLNLRLDRKGILDLGAAPMLVDRLLRTGKLSHQELAILFREGADRHAPHLARGEKECLALARTALERLQQRELEHLEERGIQTLRLGIGLATWNAKDDGTLYSAPVLLLPAHISTLTVGRPQLELTLEPELNPVMLRVLGAAGLGLSDESTFVESFLDEDSKDMPLRWESLLSEFEKSIAAKVPEFRISRDMFLATLHFAKLAMVRDIEDNAAALDRSPLIRAMVGDPAAQSRLCSPLVEAGSAELDARPASADYLVLDADGSQQRVVLAAETGRSLVVQGPPGTGKSQTIANLIAHCMATGRRVLFVAEKSAAIEAVAKRLRREDVALGHLMLDLHGAGVKRGEVMRQLRTALEAISKCPPVKDSASIQRRFETSRATLASHARRMAAPHAPLGLSLAQVCGRLMQLPAAARTHVRPDRKAFPSLTPECIHELNHDLDTAAPFSALFLGVSPSAWNGVDVRTAEAARELHDAAGQALALTRELMRSATALAAAQRLRQPESLEAIRALTTELAGLEGGYKAWKEGVFDVDAAALAAALEPAHRGFIPRVSALLFNSRFRDARRTLNGLHNAPMAMPELAVQADQLAALFARWQMLALTDAKPLRPAGFTEVERTCDQLSGFLEVLENAGALQQPARLALAKLAERLEALVADAASLWRLPALNVARAHLAAAGLDDLLADFRNPAVTTEWWKPRLEWALLQATLERAVASDPALAIFDGRVHEEVMAEFARLDADCRRLAAELVRRQHAEHAIRTMDRHPEESHLVKHEAAKKLRHLPVRKLLARAPNVVTQIAPCWMASPLSVSQLLASSDQLFDLVIFDEASQVLPEDAVPALYRAKQAIVAGDSHQLPPTTFFSTGDTESEDAADDEESMAGQGFESILDLLQATLPNTMLEWHYRSNDERLIHFSNVHVYESRLVTFPGVNPEQVVCALVVEAPGSEKGTLSPDAEVEAVVREVLQHARQRPHESLGVIAMGIKHAQRVQDAISAAVRNEPALEPWFMVDREERFFVKNLETVQGDERDAIILTVGYGRDAKGSLPHRFGPLNMAGGSRRLNVAVTRSRKRMTAISSFHAAEIDTARAGGDGVRLLKAFLHYAADANMDSAALPSCESAAAAPSGSAIAEDIAKHLRAEGLAVELRWGRGRNRIDLVTMDPLHPGEPVLGVLMDGTDASLNTTTRDRDRLRREQFERLGWQLAHVFTLDWFQKRASEIQRLKELHLRAERVMAERRSKAEAEAAAARASAASAVQAARAGAAEAATTRMADAGARAASAPDFPQQPASAAPAAPPLAPSSMRSEERAAPGAPPRKLPRPNVPSRSASAADDYDGIETYRDTELQSIVRWILSDGLLRTEEELLTLAMAELGFTRRGPRILMRFTDAIRAVRSSGGSGAGTRPA